jgi:hypothetical protein
MAIIRRKGKSKKRRRLLIDGVSGHIGKTVVVKQYDYGIVLANFPRPSRKKPTAAQKFQRQDFKTAVAVAKKIISDPVKKAAYERNLNGKRNAFQAALSEILMRDKAKESKKKP